MKTICNLIVMAIFCTLAFTSCNGNNGNAKEMQNENTTEQQIGVAEQQNSVVTEQPKSIETEQAIQKEDNSFRGVTCRDDFPSALSGSTWVTENQDRKFEFRGNTITVFNSKPRRNYDDPVEWYNAGANGFDNPPYVAYFYLIQEPKKGYYEIQYRVDPSGTTGLFNFVVDGNKFYYLENRKNKVRLNEI